MNPRLRTSWPLAVLICSGCGLYTPDKDVLVDDAPRPATRDSAEGSYESEMMIHISCEIAEGLWQVKRYRLKTPWLELWGTAVTLTITAQEQGGVSPGIASLTPMRNVVKAFPSGGPVTSAQSSSFAFGASGSASATRTETIQITYRNIDLLNSSKDHPRCDGHRRGLMINGDLKIRQFIFDKAVFADGGNGNPFEDRGWPIYNTLTDEVSFVAGYGGSFTPS